MLTQRHNLPTSNTGAARGSIFTCKAGPVYFYDFQM